MSESSIDSLPLNKERYVMFLLPKYFDKSWFESVYYKVKKSLQNKGVNVYNVVKAIQQSKSALNTNDKTTINLSFDDKPFPDVNQLYIHLFNGQYYSDTIYNRRKIEKEREMLFLLAGKLGVRQIKYVTEITETTLSKLQAGINVKSIENSASFSKSVDKKIGISGDEEYENRGAPVYLKYDKIEDVEENIKNNMGKLGSNIFSFDFYNQSPKLKAFVYKRFEFKMSRLSYSIESDDISDISFAVRSSFMDCGLNFSYDKTTIFTEKINYGLDFFSDEDLNLAFNKLKLNKEREKLDPFYSVREKYEAHDDRETAVHIICEYVMNLANKYNYRKKGDNKLIANFSDFLNSYIKDNNNNPEKAFEIICHNFRSTSQILNWFSTTLLPYDDCEIVSLEISNDINKTIIKFDENINKDKKLNNEDNLSINQPINEDKNLVKETNLPPINENDEKLKQLMFNCSRDAYNKIKEMELNHKNLNKLNNEIGLDSVTINK